MIFPTTQYVIELAAPLLRGNIPTHDALLANAVRSQDWNERFGPESTDFYPESEVVLAWDKINVRSMFLPVNFSVLYQPFGTDWEHAPVDKKSAWSACAHEFFSMTGATDSDWRDRIDPSARVYAGIFGRRDFFTESERYRALAELARISECRWARSMLSAVAREILGDGPDENPRWRIETLEDVDVVGGLVCHATRPRSLDDIEAGIDHLARRVDILRHNREKG